MLSGERNKDSEKTTVGPISKKSNFAPAAHFFCTFLCQPAKKVLSDSPGLVDFAIGLVNSVFNLPDGQVMFYEEFE